MHISVTEKVKRLCADFKEGQHTVEDFQARLEPLLMAYQVVSDRADEAFRRGVNDLELILHTLPEEQQRARAEGVAAAVLCIIEEEGL